MSRLVRRKVTVTEFSGEVKRFQDGVNVHEVETKIDGWVEMGEWWTGEGSRKLLRVLTDGQQIFDLEHIDGDWYIYKVWD
jgi:hypothetical protein